MSVFAVFLHMDSIERFIGIFTNLELAQEACTESPCDYGYLTIQKIDTDQVYFTNINEYNIKSSTDIGVQVASLNLNRREKKKASKKFMLKLHKDNDLKGFLNK